jgi:hypothetical protein
MSNNQKCPYCSGDGKKIRGRVAGQPSNLTYGYGEYTFQCGKCGEVWSQCYPVPPKGHPKVMDVPNPGILNVSFKEGTSGFANRVVLKAVSTIFRKKGESQAENSGEEKIEVESV